MSVVSRTPGILFNLLSTRYFSAIGLQQSQCTAVTEQSIHYVAPMFFSQFVGPPFSLAESSVTLLLRLEYFVACHRLQRGAGSP